MNQPLQTYLNAWLHSISGVLEQTSGDSFRIALGDAPSAHTHFDQLASSGVWLRFALGKNLKGQQAFLVSSADSVRLSTLLTGDTTADAPGGLTPDRRDALEELFRLFASSATTALKNSVGEASVQWEGLGRPTWTTAVQSCFHILSREGPITLGVALDDAADAQVTSIAVAHSTAAAAPGGTRNLDMLMDVQLQVTLRFGDRQLLLKDVLDLSPGSVVELDRHVKDPAELIVTGRVVARGEVVIVDGNYGLRVTEVAPPNQRVEALA